MKRKLTFILVLLVAVIGVSSATAQATDTKSISVTATNNGVFVLTIDESAYAFGAVDADGTANTGGTESLTGTFAGTAATYTSGTASTFSVRSAPQRTVRIFNASTLSDHPFPERLSIMIPTTGLSGGASLESCGFKTFIQINDPGAALCTLGMLVRNFTAGNGANQAAGVINFQLAVDETDATGSNTWTVVLTATGS